MDKRCGYRAVNAAAERAKHFFIAYERFEFGNLACHKVIHRPVAVHSRNVVKEVAQHIYTLLAVHDLGVVLHAVDALFFVSVRRYFAGIRACEHLETFGELFHPVRMAHPAHALIVQPLVYRRRSVVRGYLAAVFALARVLYLSAQHMCDELRAVADAEHGNTRFQNCLIYLGRALFIYAGRSAREDNALRVLGENLLRRLGAGIHFAVNVLLSYPARDQLVILTAEVEYHY